LFVHPSYEDPCPLAVLEAQAAALPTVAFDEGGIREIVADGVTGLLAPDRDVDELAHRLIQLIRDPALRSKMGAAAQERARDTFSPVRAGAEFARVIANVH
jgi:glycosyltransferase involved in cell wall biosynthesis